MKRRVRLLVAALTMAAMVTTASAAVPVTVTAAGKRISNCVLAQDVTYVPLRALAKQLGGTVGWDGSTAMVTTDYLTLTATPGNCYLTANGRYFFTGVNTPVSMMNDSVMVPVRVLARGFGAEVQWNAADQSVTVSSAGLAPQSGDSYYNSDDLYWLSRIISAEAKGETLAGKLAVGTVILNRVSSGQFPNSVYSVIFDTKNGVQFTPISNGAIYETPTEESVLAAKLCLDGARVAGNSLYFMNPVTASSNWISRNCDYVATIGNHVFYA